MENWTLRAELLHDCPVCGNKLLDGFEVKCYICNSMFKTDSNGKLQLINKRRIINKDQQKKDNR
jgi:ribosomal protein S27E